MQSLLRGVTLCELGLLMAVRLGVAPLSTLACRHSVGKLPSGHRYLPALPVRAEPTSPLPQSGQGARSSAGVGKPVSMWSVRRCLHNGVPESCGM